MDSSSAVERLAVNEDVAGSKPACPANSTAIVELALRRVSERLKGQTPWDMGVTEAFDALAQELRVASGDGCEDHELSAAFADGEAAAIAALRPEIDSWKILAERANERADRMQTELKECGLEIGSLKTALETVLNYSNDPQIVKIVEFALKQAPVSLSHMDAVSQSDGGGNG